MAAALSAPSSADAALAKALSDLSIHRDLRPKTEDVTATDGSKFQDFGLKQELLLGIFEKGYELPSPVQEKAIPRFLKGENFIARAKNGTGKTAAYLIPILQKINPALKALQALVVVPTRELAMQTSATAKELSKHLGIEVVMTTGGTDLRDDIMRFRQPVHLAVCTPGRIVDLLCRNIAKPEHCTTLVCDEADKMLSAEFSRDLDQIIAKLPHSRQICLFSATFPKSVKAFCDRYLGAYGLVNCMTELTLKGVTQFYAYIEERQKLQCINTLFARLNINQSIIFCSSVQRVEQLAKRIKDSGAACLFIHSKMDQADRNKVFHDFRAGLSRHLVSSDLITRGIDVLGVNVVINFDFPASAETYLHRIGRSGRFGHRGLAINLVTQNDLPNFQQIEKELGVAIGPIPKEIPAELYAMGAQG